MLTAKMLAFPREQAKLQKVLTFLNLVCCVFGYAALLSFGCRAHNYMIVFFASTFAAAAVMFPYEMDVNILLVFHDPFSRVALDVSSYGVEPYRCTYSPCTI